MSGDINHQYSPEYNIQSFTIKKTKQNKNKDFSVHNTNSAVVTLRYFIKIQYVFSMSMQVIVSFLCVTL